MVTGTIKEIVNDKYGNVYISDGTNELYLYGLFPGYGATGDARYYFVTNSGLKVGDNITVIGARNSYNGSPQIKNAIFFSKNN